MSRGHGGARVGAGRKPKDRPQPRITVPPPASAPPTVGAGGTVTPFTAIEGGKAGADDASGLSTIAPTDLPLIGREFWQQWAALAIEAGTLTTRTVPGFRWLCETYAEMRANEQTIERDGRTYIKVTVDGAGQEHQELKAHPLTTTLNRLRKDVDSGMARFCLTAFGKPVGDGRRKTPAANPWAKIAQQR